MFWTDQRISAELRRQLQHKVAKIRVLIWQKRPFDEARARLLRRRKYYKAKNNGKGRPPKALPAMPLDRRVLLLRLKCEAALLEEVMAKLGQDIAPLEVLKAELELRRKLETTVAKLQAGKLQRLIGQFGQTPQPLSGAVPWEAKAVRRYFVMLYQLERSKARVLGHRILKSRAEKLESDRHLAVEKCLEHILHSHHLGSPDAFRQAMITWGASAPGCTPQLTSRWKATWKKTVCGVWADLAGVFDVGGTKI